MCNHWLTIPVAPMRPCQIWQKLRCAISSTWSADLEHAERIDRSATPTDPVKRGSVQRPSRSAAVDEALGAERVPSLMAPISEISESAVSTFDELESLAVKHLSFLVNRLNHFRLSVRRLAGSAPQDFDGLQKVVGEPAREIGFRLRSDDVVNKRPMADRLATSWPVGDDSRKSISKFLAAYIGDSAHPGALVQLGLGSGTMPSSCDSRRWVRDLPVAIVQLSTTWALSTSGLAKPPLRS